MSHSLHLRLPPPFARTGNERARLAQAKTERRPSTGRENSYSRPSGTPALRFVFLAIWIVLLGSPLAFGDLSSLRTPDVWKLYVQSVAANQRVPKQNRGKNRNAFNQAPTAQPVDELKRRVCGQFGLSPDSVRVVQGTRPDAPFLAFYLYAAQPAAQGQLGAIRDSRARFRAYLRKDGLDDVNDLAFSRGALFYNRSVQEISAKNPQATLLKVRVTIAPWKLAMATFFNSTDTKKIPLKKLEHTR